MSDIRIDPDVEMPPAVQALLHRLNVAARTCYRLRDAAEHRGDIDRARDHHETGDVYLSRAIAIGAEWER